ncbi:lipopolysaccharide biosynthesis protein [Chamaesiphon sp.]|uniref:lipopolysaccharide biosynthesis protein n=1 Tax=Chamaesiphon sp. TaxID=2814140 RepID=UPI0035933D44
MKLRHNFSWTLIGNVIYAACQWGMLVTIAKLGSPEMVGQFTLGLAVTAPVIMFTNLHLRTVQVTDAKREFLFGDYLALRLLGTTVALLVIIGIVTTAGYRTETSLSILLIAVAKAFESISDVCYGFIQQNEQMDRIARSMIVKGILSLTLMSLGVYLSGTVVWGTVGLAIAWGIVLVGIDLPNTSKLLIKYAAVKVDRSPVITVQPNWNSENIYRFARLPLPLSLARIFLYLKLMMPRSRWDFTALSKLAWLSLPLGFVMMLISLNLNVPRYFIQNYLGEKTLGIFGALSYLMVVGSIVINALAESSSARLARYYAAADRRKFSILTIQLAIIFGGLGLIGILFAWIGGKQVLTLIYRPEYAQHQELFLLLTIAAAVGYVSSALGYAITAARYFRVQIPLFIAVTATSALACLWLIPTMGMRGAALALIMAAFTQLLLNAGVITYAISKLK